MLSRIQVENYRSLRHVDLEMKGLTVLIGPNGSGKSNLLDVFALMSEAATGKLNDGILRRGGLSNLLYKGGEPGLSFHFQFAPSDFDDQSREIHYDVGLASINNFTTITFESVNVYTDKIGTPLVSRENEKAVFRNNRSGDEEKRLERPWELAISQVRDQTAYPIPYELLNKFENWALYRPVQVDTDSPIRLPQTVRYGLRLLPGGVNLYSVLYSLKDQYRDKWAGLCETIRTAYPDFRDLIFPAEGGDGKINLRWAENPHPDSFSANLVSDGILRLLYLLAILETPNPPPLVCIDEPEVGLHPDVLKLVGELLESAATRTQIIVATHSPQLVSYVEPEHVVVVEKEDGATSLTRLASEAMTLWLDRYQLGELWLSGHLGGRP